MFLKLVFLKKNLYVTNKSFNIYRKVLGSLFIIQMCLMTRETNVKNLLVTLRSSYFLKEAVTLSNHGIGIIRRKRYTIIPV